MVFSSKKPLVSIIMSCYNGEEYLSEALSSIIKQNYTNWELIFWDNQSNDNSKKILNNFLTDKRIKYFYADLHTHVSEARNKAINFAKGEILAFLDVDDIWHSEKLNKQIKIYLENDNIGVVYSNYWIFKNRNLVNKKIAHNFDLPTGNILSYLLNKYVIGLLTITIKKSSYQKLKDKFFKDLVIMGDMDLMIRLSSVEEFGAVQEPLAYHRWHDNNFSKLEREMHLNEIEIWREKMKEYPIISNKKNFIKVINLYNKMKIVHFLFTKRRLKAIKTFFISSLNLNDRFILFFCIFLPIKLINLFRKNHL